MNLWTPVEIMESYVGLGGKKTAYPPWKTLLLGIVSGIIIASGCVVTNTVVHSVDNVGLARMICGLIFPFGLGIIMLMGTELFTGNCMIPISVLEGRASVTGMLKNWLLVYSGNLLGSLFTAAACVYAGQLNYSYGGLAVYTIKVAAGKTALPFGPALVLGIFCNILVCLAVLCSLAAKDVSGRILGAYLPVVFFVIAGFEHCVANMYYIPAGILAAMVPQYAAKAAEAGIDLSTLHWGGFFSNLLPVTIGNILGGAAIALVLWKCHCKAAKKQESLVG